MATNFIYVKQNKNKIKPIHAKSSKRDRITQVYNLLTSYKMTKKEYIRKILQKLIPYLSVASFLLNALQENIESEKELDAILEIIQKNLHLIQDEKEKIKFQKAIETIKSMHTKEATERSEEIK